eukprot:TRINITY_DN4831_c0_g3_i1.p4 TRINITY_DN4831_c0_g3~~TRINITY_DN4831_c0_g3_i1.p4  ORF type:complete len:105 (-),score=26.35 TRINITY_DN4831_c0_g3_i1:157-471(-)
MGTSYYKALIAYTNVTGWSKVHNNPPCVQEIIHKNYWVALNKTRTKEEPNYPLSSILPVFLGALAVIAVIVALLIYAFIRKKMAEKEERLANEEENETGMMTNN